MRACERAYHMRTRSHNPPCERTSLFTILPAPIPVEQRTRENIAFFNSFITLFALHHIHRYTTILPVSSHKRYNTLSVLRGTRTKSHPSTVRIRDMNDIHSRFPLLLHKFVHPSMYHASDAAHHTPPPGVI
jgi:hypothetical protein